MIFNGERVPYVEVAYEFARNPSRYSYEWAPRSRGGARLRQKRLEPVEIPIPVVFSRRDTSKSWDEIKTELAGLLYRDMDAKISFTHGDGKYYLAQVIAIEFTEEHDYVAKGIITIVSEKPYRFGDSKALAITSEFQTFIVGGQAAVDWTSRTRFSVPQSSFTLETNKGGKIVLNYDFIAGDVLEIKYETRDVFLNGKDLAVSIALETVWFELEPGAVQIKASQPTEMKYTERYH